MKSSLALAIIAASCGIGLSAGLDTIPMERARGPRQRSRPPAPPPAPPKLSELDVARLAKAEAKRARKAAKRRAEAAS